MMTGGEHKDTAKPLPGRTVVGLAQELELKLKIPS